MTRLRDICVDDVRQKLHLEAGPGTRLGSYLCGKIAGSDWQAIFRDARRWFEANYETLPKDGIATKVFLFGFSRGALIARHFAAWLDKLGVEVDYLGLWDTVDATIGLDVAADCPRNVKKARHAVSRDETRKFFQYVPLKGDKGQVVEMLFPGSHSDVGGLYDDNHLVADLALAWIAAGAKREGLRLKRTARLSQKLDASAVVAPPGFRKSSTLQPSSCTTPMVNPPISGASSTAFAAISRESDFTSLAKDSERTILRQFLG